MISHSQLTQASPQKFIYNTQFQIMDKLKQQNMARIQTQLKFQKLFQQDENSLCFECGKHCKQWVESRHAIFLCLNCAARYREISRVSNIKSVSLDRWTPEEMDMLTRGGNGKFREFLGWYDLQWRTPEEFLRSKAAQFYRLYLLNPEKLQLANAPPIEQGKAIDSLDAPLTEMTSDEFLQQAKNKIAKAGQTTLYYGNKAYEKISQKIATGELKQDAKKAADKVSETAKILWGFVSSKIEEFSSTAKTEDKENARPNVTA